MAKKKRVNSRAKGKVIEREARDAVRAAGFQCERGVQHKGGTESPDIKCPGLRGHLEVTCSNGIRLGNAVWKAKVAQAIRDADGRPWLLIWRRTGERWWCYTFQTSAGIVTTVEPEFLVRWLGAMGAEPLEAAA